MLSHVTEADWLLSVRQEPRKAKRHLQEVRAGLNFACGADSATATDVLNGLANAGLS